MVIVGVADQDGCGKVTAANPTQEIDAARSIGGRYEIWYAIPIEVA